MATRRWDEEEPVGRRGLWLETAALFILGGAALVWGITRLGSEVCNDDGCIKGAPVNISATALIVLGGVMLLDVLVTGYAALEGPSSRFAYAARPWALGVVIIAALIAGICLFFSSPSFYT